MSSLLPTRIKDSQSNITELMRRGYRRLDLPPMKKGWINFDNCPMMNGSETCVHSVQEAVNSLASTDGRGV